MCTKSRGAPNLFLENVRLLCLGLTFPLKYIRFQIISILKKENDQLTMDILYSKILHRVLPNFLCCSDHLYCCINFNFPPVFLFNIEFEKMSFLPL